MPLLQLRPALLTEIFKAAQALLRQVRTVFTHHPRSPFPFEHRPTRIAIALITHAAFDADPLLGKDCEEVVWHEIVAWAKTMTVHAVLQVVVKAVAFVFRATHLLVAEGGNYVVEVFVRQSEEHGGGEQFEITDDL